MMNHGTGTLVLLLALFSLSTSGCAWKMPFSGKKSKAVEPYADFRDIHGDPVPIGGGKVTVVSALRLRGYDRPALPRRPLPGRTFADPEVRMLSLLDVNHALPDYLEKRVNKELQGPGEKEWKRIVREIEKAGLDAPRRPSFQVAVDMNGTLPIRMGLVYDGNGHATAVFDRVGRLVRQWGGDAPTGELLSLVGQVRGGMLAGPQPVPGGGASRAVVIMERGGRALPGVSAAPAVVQQRQPAPLPPRTMATQAPPVVTTPNLPPSKLPQDDQAILTRLVKNGRILHFTGKQAVFAPFRAPTSLRRPAPFQDAAIESAIRARIASDPGLFGRRIEIRSREGSVSLSGDLRDLGVASSAVDTALAIEGVFDVAVRLD